MNSTRGLPGDDLKLITTGLRSPGRVLYEEIWNGEASWTDALFWYLMGALTVGAIWLVTVVR